MSVNHKENKMNQIDRFPVKFKIGTKIFDTFSTRLVKSNVLYDLIKTKSETYNNSNENNECPMLLEINEDPMLFGYLLHYIRYPQYHPPENVKDVFPAILEKYGVEPKYHQKNELFKLSKMIVEENNGNINEAFFKSYNTDVYSNIYNQGVDINYDGEATKDLYNCLITKKSRCDIKFIWFLYNRGRNDLIDKKSLKHSQIYRRPDSEL